MFGPRGAATNTDPRVPPTQRYLTVEEVASLGAWVQQGEVQHLEHSYGFRCGMEPDEGIKLFDVCREGVAQIGSIIAIIDYPKIRLHRWAILDLRAVPSDLLVAGNAFKWVTTSTGCRLHPKCNDRYLAKISRFSYLLSSRTPVQRV